MTVLNATEARSKLYSLIDETLKTHKPIVVNSRDILFNYPILKILCVLGVLAPLSELFG